MIMKKKIAFRIMRFAFRIFAFRIMRFVLKCENAKVRNAKNATHSDRIRIQISQSRRIRIEIAFAFCEAVAFAFDDECEFSSLYATSMESRQSPTGIPFGYYSIAEKMES